MAAEARQQDALEELTRLVTTLASQVTALTGQLQQQGGGGATAVDFALSPAHCGREDIIDFKSRGGRHLYDSGKKPLDTKFDLKASGILQFMRGTRDRCDEMAFSVGTMQVTIFTNADGEPIDIIRHFGQISMESLRTGCEPFISGAGRETRRAQNNDLFGKFLMASLTPNAVVTVHTHRTDYTMAHGNVEVVAAPLLYKVIMRCATMDSKATSSALRANLKRCPQVILELDSNITKFHEYVDLNLIQLQARGDDKDDMGDLLIESYRAAGDANFRAYWDRRYDDYIDETGTMKDVTVEGLMTMAQRLYTLKESNNTWGAPSAQEEQIIAMQAELTGLRGQLKLAGGASKQAGSRRPAKGASTQSSGGGGGAGGAAKKNKKNTSDKTRQKKVEAWKKSPPKAGESHTKKVGDKTFIWCVHHMAWLNHKSEDCELGKRRAAEQGGSTTVTANQATAARASATVNPYMAALATIAEEQE